MINGVRKFFLKLLAGIGGGGGSGKNKKKQNNNKALNI